MKEKIFKKNRSPRVHNFKNFLFLAWQSFRLPEPDPVQYDIAEFMQEEDSHVMVQAFRGVGKTYISVAYAMWRLHLDPNLKIAIISQSAEFAKKVSGFCLQLMENLDILRELIPTSKQRSSVRQFDVALADPAKDPSVYSVGIDGQVTGSRADIVIADDVETSNNSMTQLQREQLREKTNEFSFILKPGGKIIYLGTPHSEDSIYNGLPQRGYKVQVWPAQVPLEKKKHLYVDRISVWLDELFESEPAGSPVCPNRFDDEVLYKSLIGTSPSEYALQMMLDTSLADADKYPLKLQDLIVMDIDNDVAPEKVVWARDRSLQYDNTDIPNVGMTGDSYYKPMKMVGDWLPYQSTIMSIDPSGRGQDETGYAVIKFLNGYLYVTEAGGFLGGFDEPNLIKLAEIAKKQKVNSIVIESNFGGGAWSELLKGVLKNIHPCPIEEVIAKTMKDVRIIDSLEPVISNHRLIVSSQLIRNDFNTAKRYAKGEQASYQLFYQMTRIHRSKGSLKRYDRLDALAIGVQYWADRMAYDANASMRERQDEKDEALRKRFEKWGYNPPKRGVRRNSLKNPSDKPTLW